MVVHRFGPGFTCLALLRDRVASTGLGFAYGAVTRCGRPPMPFRSPSRTWCPGAAAPGCAALQPRRRNPLPGMPARRFGPSVPFRSPLLGALEIDFLSSGYLDVFSSPVCPPPPCVQRGICILLLCMGSPIRRPPGRRMCSPGLSQLAASFIGSCAKASAVRPWYLAGPHRARGISTCR